MAVYTLQGSGVIGINTGTGRLIVEVLVYPRSYSFGKGVPNNYYDIGLLRVGVQGVYFPTKAIDATAMLLEVPQDANNLGYWIADPGTVRVTEVPWQQTVPGWALQPWDRNPVIVQRSGAANVPPNTIPTQLWDYTVPAGKIYRASEIDATVSPFTQPGAQSAVCLMDVRINNVSMCLAIASPGGMVGGRDTYGGGLMDLPAGTVVSAVYTNNLTDTMCQVFAGMTGFEFDAA